MRNKRGFTLVEIMIVVAIVALLAAIAIPNLLRARHNANETAAIASCRTVSTALETHRASTTPPTYPDALVNLVTAQPAYLDDVLGNDSTGSSQKQGYEFTYTPGGSHIVSGSTIYEQFNLIACPLVSGTTGTRSFYVDETGVIRVGTEAGVNADSGSPALE